MTDLPGGYGRYKDDPNHVGCPRAQTDMTPCIARDGATALADGCVGCGCSPRQLLGELTSASSSDPRMRLPYAEAADRLRDLVREITEPRAGEADND